MVGLNGVNLNMAHFAKLNDDNVVIGVHVVENKYAETEADGTWNKVSSVSTKIDPVLLFVEFDQATSILCQLFFFRKWEEVNIKSLGYAPAGEFKFIVDGAISALWLSCSKSLKVSSAPNSSTEDPDTKDRQIEEEMCNIVPAL